MNEERELDMSQPHRIGSLKKGRQYKAGPGTDLREWAIQDSNL